MSKRALIRLTAGAERFNYRIAGLGFRDGHVLAHRAVHEPFWTFPGGRAEIGETSEVTLKREMVEELGVDVTVFRLLWIVENFFRYEQHDWHELGLYYLMDIPPEFPFQPGEIIHHVEDGDNHLEFKWVLATREALTDLDIPPYFIADEIENLPIAPRHLVWRDGNLDEKGRRKPVRKHAKRRCADADLRSHQVIS